MNVRSAMIDFKLMDFIQLTKTCVYTQIIYSPADNFSLFSLPRTMLPTTLQLSLLVCHLASMQVTAKPSGICTQHRERIKHHFYAVRHCQRSNQSIIGLINTNTVQDCAEFARTKQGMAFNFGPANRVRNNLFDTMESHSTNTGGTSSWSSKKEDSTSTDPDEFYNCQILECPEYQNFSSIVNDTRFDYYSLYSRPTPSINATCLPSIGMFILDDRKLNYSQAYNECRSMSGSLAHIASEARTNMIARMCAAQGDVVINGTSNITDPNVYYVGLNETARQKFYTSADEPLDCFLYRAWAPGHPRKTRQPSCVAISTNRSWTTHNCNQPKRFVCELHTSGPPKHEVQLKR
ncbi:uncharacterized protein LOC131431044 [Malaya genurostris]|uniref:uncharacterized protein LOC131431044 n=1 Tax=Malaya genurostris TaxID=325434 RepID=UPI0026F3AF33|nr:uncharacterized protein LOC131431044 [Malaya genurostris]